MELQVQTAAGKAADKLAVADKAFGREFNESLVHQVVTAYLAAGRAGTKAQKNRSAVRGGGSKPWRQKGTGRARAGSIRSPLWRSGGVTFAASPRDYSQKVNRKAYRAALSSILSELVRQERLVVVDDFKAESKKTKDLMKQLQALGLNNCLILTEDVSEELYLASRNIPYVGVSDVAGVNPVSLVGFEKVLVTAGAVKRLEEWLA